jgi:hypothetical protein
MKVVVTDKKGMPERRELHSRVGSRYRASSLSGVMYLNNKLPYDTISLE